jgi:hypothetical protein
VRAAARTPVRRAGDDAVPRPARLAEVAWTLVPAIVLAAVLLLTWQAINRTAPSSERRAADTAPEVARGS